MDDLYLNGYKETRSKRNQLNICIAGRLPSDIHNVTNREGRPKVAHLQWIAQGKISIRRSDRRWSGDFVETFRGHFLPMPPNAVEVAVMHIEERIYDDNK